MLKEFAYGGIQSQSKDIKKPVPEGGGLDKDKEYAFASVDHKSRRQDHLIHAVRTEQQMLVQMLPLLIG